MPMFADELALLTEKKGSFFRDHMYGKKIKKALDNCQKFVFNQELVEAAENLSNNKPSKLLDAITWARAPFPNTWLEFTYSYLDDSGNSQTKRMGYLVSNPDMKQNCGSVYLFLDEGSNKPYMLGYYMLYDFTNVIPDWTNSFLANQVAEPAEIQEAIQALGTTPEDSVQDIRNKKLNTDILHELDKPNLKLIEKSDEELMSLMQLTWRRLPLRDKSFHHKNVRDKLPQPIQEQVWLDPWDQGGFTMFIALLVLLNMRNCIEREDVASKTTHRYEGRTTRLQPLYSHHTVKLVLSRAQQQRLESAGIAQAERRLHLVRGHPKVRKTGTFWWTPFVRGRKESGLVTKDYDVAE